MLTALGRVVMDLGAPLAVTLPVVLEGGAVVLLILETLTQCEMKVIPVFGLQIAALQLRLHLSQLLRAEAEGLEVGEAPPRFPETGVQLECAPVGADPLARPAGGLERMPVAQPQLRLARVLLEHAGVDVDGARIFPDTREDRGLETAVVGVARLGGEQLLDVWEGSGMLALAVQRHGVVVTSTGEAGRELEAARQQTLGVVVAPEARGVLGEHADRGDIGRMLAQMRAQQRFGFGDAVVAQRRRRGHQARVTRGRLEKARSGGLRPRLIPPRPEVIGERTPRVRKIRVQRQSPAQ